MAAGAEEVRRRSVRSAVEEARIRAQREAESFANSRRAPAKKEGAVTGGGGQGSHSDASGRESIGERRAKRGRVREERDGGGSERGATAAATATVTTTEERGGEEVGEVEKQERYKRRLDMNRESAAVSRVRRRAYVKELEERLATVEAEKLQLEGKLEIMMSQNDGFKKQLDNLFLMVTGGARPPLGPAQGQGQQGPPPPPQGDGP